MERHLLGKDSELKESVLAVEVFGRDASYDPKLDAIVRTEAMRLRARLDKYYAAEGSRDPLIIELPKGAYRPSFRERAPVQAVHEIRSDWIRLGCRRDGGRGDRGFGDLVAGAAREGPGHRCCPAF